MVHSLFIILQIFDQKQCSVFVSITGSMLRTCNNLDINNGKNQDNIFCVISAQSIKKLLKLFNLRKCLLLVSIANIYFLVQSCFLSLNNSKYDPLFCHYTSQNTLQPKRKEHKNIKNCQKSPAYLHIFTNEKWVFSSLLNKANYTVRLVNVSPKIATFLRATYINIFVKSNIGTKFLLHYIF